MAFRFIVNFYDFNCNDNKLIVPIILFIVRWRMVTRICPLIYTITARKFIRKHMTKTAGSAEKSNGY